LLPTRDTDIAPPEASRGAAILPPASLALNEPLTPIDRAKQRANELSNKLSRRPSNSEPPKTNEPLTASERARERAKELSRKLVSEGKFETRWDTVSGWLIVITL